MRINAETARKKMNENIQKKNIERRKQKAEKAVDEILVPIEKAIENCNYQVYVKKTLLDDFCISDCYAILEANGFRYTNFIDEFLIEW